MCSDKQRRQSFTRRRALFGWWGGLSDFASHNFEDVWGRQINASLFLLSTSSGRAERRERGEAIYFRLMVDLLFGSPPVGHANDP